VATLAECLGRLGPSFWRELYDSSAHASKRLRNAEWWHTKLYHNNPPNDGYAEQVVFETSYREVPYERNMFRASRSGRFSLGEAPVAYFSRDHVISCCETFAYFRDNEDLAFSDIVEKFENVQPPEDWYGFPLPVRLAKGTVVANLTGRTCRLFVELQRVGLQGDGGDFYNEVVKSWNAEKRKETQAISVALKENGFDGVRFASVRTPNDVMFPDDNLVLYRPETIIRDPWDVSNPDGFMWKGEKA
jgi:RES domain-containing protein